MYNTGNGKIRHHTLAILNTLKTPDCTLLATVYDSNLNSNQCFCPLDQLNGDSHIQRQAVNRIKNIKHETDVFSN